MNMFPMLLTYVLTGFAMSVQCRHHHPSFVSRSYTVSVSYQSQDLTSYIFSSKTQFSPPIIVLANIKFVFLINHVARKTLLLSKVPQKDVYMLGNSYWKVAIT